MAAAYHVIKQHAISLLSVTAITLNLLFWTIPLLAVVATQAVVRSSGAKSMCYGCVDWIYRRAVDFNSWWVVQVLQVDIRIHGELPQDPAEQLIVVSNHRSWFDILVLHRLVTTTGPIIKFLIKRELIYVPVIGWLCLALKFPRLRRGKTADGRERDYQSVMAAAQAATTEPGALLNFAEGTRFTERKRRDRGSIFPHLLNPRSGGLRIMLETLPDARILDCTLVYPDDDLTFWRSVGGDLKVVEAWLDYIATSDVTDANAWLAERWRLKEERIDASSIRSRADA